MTSRKVRTLSDVMAATILAEQLVFGRVAPLRRPPRMHESRDGQEMAVVEIVGDAVAAPASASHRQRERQGVVVAPARREAMGLIDDDAAHGERVAEGGRARRFPRMQTDRMTGPLVAKQAVGELC